jgi:hypothetical protein
MTFTDPDRFDTEFSGGYLITKIPVCKLADRDSFFYDAFSTFMSTLSSLCAA